MLLSPEIRASFKSELHQQLADATELVWRLQNSLSEQNAEPTALELAGLVKEAFALRERANVILGHVFRWSQIEEEDAAREGL